MPNRQEGINMKTVIYARKSRGTIEELNSQIEICKDYCNKNSYVVSEVFAEIRSSQDFEREQYVALKRYIKENTHVRVVVSHADRLNRSLIEQAKLNELLLSTASYIEVVGSGIVKLDTPEQQMLSNIINSFNEYNYKLIRHKMLTGLHSFQERGGKVGRTPIGYIRADKYHYVLDMEKCDIVKQIFTDIASGLSTKEVVNKLEQINFRSNNNKRIGTREVRNIVRNEVYYENIPQIVTRELWLEANSQLRSISNRGKRTYPLSNKIVCSHCNTPLIIGYKADRGYPIVNSCNSSRSVRGNHSNKCDCMGVKYATIESIVKSDCLAYLENRLAVMYDLLKSNEEILQEHKQELVAIQSEIEVNSQKLQKLNDLYLLNNITAEDLKEKSIAVKDTIALLNLKRERVEGFSLYDRVQQIQNDIVKLEELQNSVNINDLVVLVDYVQYYKDSTGISVNTVFKS